VRDSVEEIAGPVERVDDPARLAFIAFDGSRFLHDETPARTRLAEFVIERALGAHVGLGDEIGRPLAADLEVFDLAEIAAQSPARLARGAFHHANEA